MAVGKFSLSYSQTKITNNDISFYKDIPQEKLFVHLNTSFLLTGEHLFYKAYCINTKTNKLSDISKIAYVELISSDKTQIFKHKIRLESGLGQGDFFLPRSILSGNYKLIAYTQWMKHSSENIFFQNDISIINTFNQNQNQILHKNELKDTLIATKPLGKINILGNVFSEGNNALIELQLNKESFKNREKVSLKIKNLNNEVSYGNYSISVRKVDPIIIPDRLTTKKFVSEALQKNIYTHSKKSNAVYLPELRGELLSGKVVFEDTKLFASNIKVALSIPGKEYIFIIANTNDSGIFYFHLAKEYENYDATIQIINKKRENYIIELDRQTSLVYDDFIFNDFKLRPK